MNRKHAVLFAVLLTLSMALSLAACGDTNRTASGPVEQSAADTASVSTGDAASDSGSGAASENGEADCPVPMTVDAIIVQARESPEFSELIYATKESADSVLELYENVMYDWSYAEIAERSDGYTVALENREVMVNIEIDEDLLKDMAEYKDQTGVCIHWQSIPQ